MRWSRRQLRVATAIQAIERARKAAAEAGLAEARNRADDAANLRMESQSSLGDAERDWRSHLSSGRIDLELGTAFAARLLERQRGAEASEKSALEADSVLELERRRWRELEATVRSGDANLRRGRNQFRKRADNARDQEISDRTSWSWFKS